MNTYTQGNPAPLETVVYVDGIPTDPGLISLTVIAPDGSETTFAQQQMAHPGPGRYRYDFDTTGADTGNWVYEFVAMGGGGLAGAMTLRNPRTNNTLRGGDSLRGGLPTGAAADVGYFRVEALPAAGALLPRTGPCAAWVSGAQVLAMPYPDDVTVDAATAQEMATFSSEVLYNLSGQQFTGQCGPVTVRPISRPTDADTRGLVSRMPSGYVAVWGWSSAWGQAASGAASHYGTSTPPEVELGAYPVTQVQQVKLDGVVIPPSEYYVQDYRTLVRIRPTAAAVPTDRYGWPTTQIMDLPDTEPGTFSVTYIYGTPPPASGVTAAKRFAKELAVARVGGNSALPQRITSITRAGESMAVVDVEDIVSKRLTGIYEIDLFIKAFNPSGSTRRPIVWSPDLGRARKNPANLS